MLWVLPKASNPVGSIKELVKKIFNLMNVNFNEIAEVDRERLGKDQSYLLDSQKIRSFSDWSQEKDLSTGLNETIKWVDRHLDKLIEMPWHYLHKS